jgi:hypothetical protein
MNTPATVLDELYAALQHVSDVLGKVPDSDWNTFVNLQNQINLAQELVTELREAK